MLKGTVSQDFRLLFFFMNQFPKPLVYWWQILPPVSTTPAANLPSVSTTPAANLPSVSTTPAANLPLVSTTLAKLVAKFADGFVDTGGKVCQQYTQGLGGTDS
jgi:hypothetical protein